MAWLAEQWQDIKGNVKYAIIVVVITGLVTGFGIVTHGLNWWQQAIILCILAVVVAWATVATVLTLKQKASVEGDDKPDRFVNPRWETVSDRDFLNEGIAIDGKKFYKCTFANTRLLFHGSAPTEFIDCEVSGTVILETDNEAAKHYGQLCRMFGGTPSLEEIGIMLVDSKGKGKRIASGLRDVKEIDPLQQAEMSLQQRALALAVRVREFIRLHGPRPDPERADGENTSDYVKRRLQKTRPWDDKVAGGYKSTLLPDLLQVCGELAERGLTDPELDASFRVERPQEEKLRTIVEKLRYLASKLDD